MKKQILLLSTIACASFSQAQIFSDDFESYAVGSYLGPQSTQWTTWSGTEGGAEDVQITNNQASSGTNSIYFSSTGANGGPQDVVLNFGSQYTSNIFVFEANFFIQTGKNAYFNFQATPTIGQTWALNFNADTAGITIDDGSTVGTSTSSCPINTWFNLRIEANLTLGVWEAFVDNTSIGSWNNGVNSVASADIYPVNGSGFYVDDVSFDVIPFTLPNLNAAVTSLNMGGNIAGLTVDPVVTIQNAGATTITSYDINLSYNGNNYSQNISTTLASIATEQVTFTGVTIVPGSNNAVVTITNINGGADDDSSDDQLTLNIDPVVPAPGKMVVGEEGTGTWCGWCPRGTVWMDRFENNYAQFWAGIAVHNGDPMTVTDYDAGIGALIGGYPSALVDRGADLDPSGMTNEFLARLQVAPTAFISATPTYNATNNELTVNVSADFQAAANNNYKLAVVLTEDNVTGSTSGYSQANYYSSSSQNIDLVGDNGVNWKNLPNPVPFGQMEYDHVARAIAPSFGGDATAFPATVNAGQVISKTYTLTMDPSWNILDMHVIAMLIDPNGRIDNAAKMNIAFLGAEELNTEVDKFVVYPNPTSTVANTFVSLTKASDVSIELLNMNGQLISSMNYSQVNGQLVCPMDVNNLSNGMYIVRLTTNGQVETRNLVINR